MGTSTNSPGAAVLLCLPQAEFMEDLDALGCRRPTAMPRVSEYVPEIVAYVQRIISNGMAYECGGSVYFDIATFW
jgi:cysteinyl-tRNA synthetase